MYTDFETDVYNKGAILPHLNRAWICRTCSHCCAAMAKGAAVSNAHATSPCSVLLSTCISMGNPMLELLQEPEAPLLITNDPTTRLLNGSHAYKSLFLLFQKSCPSCHSFKFLSAFTPQPDGVLVRNRGKNPYSPFIIHNSMAASMFFPFLHSLLVSSKHVSAKKHGLRRRIIQKACRCTGGVVNPMVTHESAEQQTRKPQNGRCRADCLSYDLSAISNNQRAGEQQHLQVQGDDDRDATKPQ